MIVFGKQCWPVSPDLNGFCSNVICLYTAINRCESTNGQQISKKPKYEIIYSQHTPEYVSTMISVWS